MPSTNTNITTGKKKKKPLSSKAKTAGKMLRTISAGRRKKDNAAKAKFKKRKTTA